MKTAFARLAALCAALFASGFSMAQSEYPNRPIRLVVPFAAGGPTDILGRVIAQELGQRLGQPVVAENRPGATGVVGQDFVAKSAPDGYTLVMLTNTASNNYHLLGRTIDFAREFSMIAQIYSSYTVLMVNPAVPGMANIHNLAQLVAHVKANPGTVNYTSSGSGGLGHLTVAKFASHYDLKMEHISYKGQAPAMNDVLAGRIPIMSGTFTNVPFVKAGKLRAIAVATPKRSPTLPDVPTFIEQGVPGLVAGVWGGLAGPGGMPAAIVGRLASELRAGLAKPDVADRVRAAVGVDHEYLPPAEFTANATRDWEYWGRVIRENGIKAEQ